MYVVEVLFKLYCTVNVCSKFTASKQAKYLLPGNGKQYYFVNKLPEGPMGKAPIKAGPNTHNKEMENAESKQTDSSIKDVHNDIILFSQALLFCYNFIDKRSHINAIKLAWNSQYICVAGFKCQFYLILKGIRLRKLSLLSHFI